MILDVALILLIIFNVIFCLWNARGELIRYHYLINRIEGIERDIFDLDDEIEELKEAKP